MKHSVNAIVLKHFSVHDQLVEEVQLLLLRLHADVRLLYPILHELLHLIFV